MRSRRSSIFTFKSLYLRFVRTFPRYLAIPPTFFEIDILLSFKIMIRFDFICSALFRASKAIPPESAPSPMTATTFSSLPRRSRALARPSATDNDVELCPVLNVSARFSLTFGNPLKPSSRRRLRKSFSLPVSIL